MEQVTTLGIDLAKRVFALHGIDGMGRVVLRQVARREQLIEAVVALPPCRIGMEACGGAHEWARRFTAMGHEVKLMAAKFVTPYRKNGKNDGNDAEAICEAVGRPNMRFCTGEVGRATGSACIAPHARGVRDRAHRGDQPHPSAADGIWREPCSTPRSGTTPSAELR